MQTLQRLLVTRAVKSSPVPNRRFDNKALPGRSTAAAVQANRGQRSRIFSVWVCTCSGSYRKTSVSRVWRRTGRRRAPPGAHGAACPRGTGVWYLVGMRGALGLVTRRATRARPAPRRAAVDGLPTPRERTRRPRSCYRQVLVLVGAAGRGLTPGRVPAGSVQHARRSRPTTCTS